MNPRILMRHLPSMLVIMAFLGVTTWGIAQVIVTSTASTWAKAAALAGHIACATRAVMWMMESRHGRKDRRHAAPEPDTMEARNARGMAEYIRKRGVASNRRDLD